MHEVRKPRATVTKPARLDQELLQTALIERRLGVALDIARQFMQSVSPRVLLNSLLEAADKATVDVIEQAIITVDHTGFLVPAKTTLSDLHEIANQNQFTENHKTFESMIVASELTAMNDGIPVRAQIFRASIPRDAGRERSFGVEMFVPDAEPETVDRWIARGVGTHCAFRVRQRQSVDQIRTLLLNVGYHTPAFMGGELMTNANDGTLTVYFELEVPKGAFRVEFFHRAGV